MHEFVPACKKNCSGEIVDLKILQSDWLRSIWSISQEYDFSQIQDLRRNTANNIKFHNRKNAMKINDQFFLKIQKTLFLPHFPNL